MRRARLIASVAALAVALGLTGCAGLPTSGPVSSAEPEAGAQAPLAQHAEGPREGASVRQIVEDFLRASAAGSYDDFEVAKQYLTTKAAETWVPDASITVLEEDPAQALTEQVAPSPTAATPEVRLAGTAVLAVDRQGRQVPSDLLFHGAFQLQRESGEWRIARLPDGIVMTRSAFNNAYARRDVYFYTPDAATPVPDPRWVPRQNLVGGLISALYAGPSAEIAPVVRTAIPAGLAETIPVVDVTGSLASVTVPDEIASLSLPQRTRMAWQLQQTLQGVSGVTRVELVSGREPLTVDPLPSPPDYDLDYLVGVEHREIIRFTDTHTQTLVGRAQLGSVSPRWPATGPLSGQAVVAVSGDRTDLYLFEQGTRRLLAHAAEAFSPPSLDKYGLVWTSTPKQGLAVYDQSGQRLNATTPWGRGESFTKVALTADGSRAVVLLHEAQGRDRVAVATVKRSSEGIELVEAFAIAQPIEEVSDVGWVDATTAVVLSGAGSPEIIVHPVNGLEEIYAAPADAVSLVTGGTAHDLQVAMADRRRQERVGKQWRPVGSAVTDVRYAG